jgi:hypothetical protein
VFTSNFFQSIEVGVVVEVTREHILNEEKHYLVALTRRKDYLMLCTAFYIEQEHTVRKKIKEYEAYKKTKTA